MCEKAAGERAKHGEHENQNRDEPGEDLRHVAHERLFPDRLLFELTRRSGGFFVERRVDDVHAVAALLVVADGILDQLRYVVELVGCERRALGLPVRAGRTHVVDEDSNCESLQAAGWRLGVRHAPIDFVVAGALL